MSVDRNQLEMLDRDALVQRARSFGVKRAEVLTRPELVDEILSAVISDDQERRRARGLLGRARDLLARVIEKGLHLPDAAQRLRTLAPPLSAWRRGPPPLATLSLAEIYASQGHKFLALKVLDEVLAREPEHRFAQELRQRVLQMPDPVENAPNEPMPPAHDTQRGASPATPHIKHAVEVREIPTTSSVQIAASATTLRTSWRIRPLHLARARAAHPTGRLMLRTIFVQPTWKGPSSRWEDMGVDCLTGEISKPLTHSGTCACAAVGWCSDSGFAVLASGPIVTCDPHPPTPS